MLRKILDFVFNLQKRALSGSAAGRLGGVIYQNNWNFNAKVYRRREFLKTMEHHM